MQAFKEILSIGGHSNSLGDAAQVVEHVINHLDRLSELYDCASDDDAWVRMRAIDSFEKVVRTHPQWVKPYIEDILERLTKSAQPSIQWHIAEILAYVELTDAQRSTAVVWLTHRIKTVEVDWIVSANVMKTLLQFCREGYVDASRVRPLFEVQRSHHSKSVRKKASQLLEQL